jgi:GDPmannose 4,6-dehydratase
MKKSLICGISGQDGAYLASLLLTKGHTVYGTSRDAEVSSFRNLETLGIRDKVKLESMALNDFRSVLQVLIKTEPDEIYNLAGQTSVGLSFAQPVETLESIATGTLNLLEAIRFTKAPIKFYNAGSSECFGDTGEFPANESTPFRPRSPYAVAKSASFWEVANYREAYNIFACSGILFNHDSPLRPERFVTQKIISAICRIADGSSEQLILGNTNIQRDWGWADDYVEAMYLMLQQPEPDDYVIATGQSNSLQKFVETGFAYFGINASDRIVIDQSLFRPSEIMKSYGDPEKAKQKLGWQAKYEMKDIIAMMIEAKKSSANWRE